MKAIDWVIRIAIGLGVAAAALILAAWWLAMPPTPDRFYNHAAINPPDRPGVLLASDAYTRGVPAGARGWRILYTTTRGDGGPIVASGVVVAREGLAAPAPVIAWAHGTTGLAPGCARSVSSAPFGFVAAFEEMLGEGWVYVATDHAGLGVKGVHPYLIGPDEARGVLDAVRAARAIEGLALDGRTAVWGHSQGGHAALWAGIEAPDYAPDVPLSGVVAIAPASDLPGLVEKSKATPFGKVVLAYAVTAYSRVYPDVSFDDYIRPMARPLVSDIAGRCVMDARALFSIAQSFLLSADSMFGIDPVQGAMGERLRANVPAVDIVAPVMIAQGLADDVVWPGVQADYVAERCAAGQLVDYRTYAGRDHISVLAPDAPLTQDIMAWTRARFAGEAAAPACASSVN